MTDLTPRLCLLPCLISGLFPFSTQAAELHVTTDQVVVTATRMEEKSFDLPVSIDQVSGEMLRDSRPMVNLTETAVRIPGVVVNNRFNAAQDLAVSSRGFGARGLVRCPRYAHLRRRYPSDDARRTGADGHFQSRHGEISRIHARPVLRTLRQLVGGRRADPDA
jgi:outer membrane receptor protein involved in Fe transport